VFLVIGVFIGILLERNIAGKEIEKANDGYVQYPD
jgi:hypothetical protein